MEYARISRSCHALPFLKPQVHGQDSRGPLVIPVRVSLALRVAQGGEKALPAAESRACSEFLVVPWHAGACRVSPAIGDRQREELRVTATARLSQRELRTEALLAAGVP